MMASAFVALVCWAVMVSSQALPYVPTTVLPLSDSWACENRTNRGLYIFSPTDTKVDLLFLNTSSTLEASSLRLQTLTSGLPFVGQSRTAAFTASVADDGTLTVFAGDCSYPGSEAIWTYGQVDSTSSPPEWVKHAAGQSSTSTSTPGAPYLLGGSLSFSSTIAPSMSPPVTYVYGGMCPWTNSSTSTWQSAANYSNHMLKVSPMQSREGTIYTAEPTASTGPPVAEAGFSFTALTPAISNRSGTVTQQISYVLLGGHTKSAFINMSTAAVWNLPEETWNFVSINPPAATYENTELAIKALSRSVDSRSGHTAVLNEEGTALVILGGWVGDLTQAASPQLAVLEMGASLADWRWSVPDVQPAGAGIYGHGAVLLPGNVMMVYGGYAISSTATARARRRDTTHSPMFFNLTSLTWSNTYTNPTTTSTGSIISTSSSGTSSPTSSPSSTSIPGSSSQSKRPLTLGLALGLGIPLLLLLLALALWYRQYRRRNRLRRDQVVAGLSQDASRFLSTEDEDHDPHSAFFPPAWDGTAARDWYTGGGDPYARGSRSLGYETLRGSTGRASYPPPLPPTASASGLGRSRSAARGLYLPTTSIGGGGGYEFGGAGGGKKGIHPIYEAEDEDGEITAAAVAHDNNHTAGERSASVSPEHGAESDDPFLTPASTPRGNQNFGSATMLCFPPLSQSNGRAGATPSPTRQDAEVQNWVSDIDAADAVLSARIGPHGGTTTTTGLTPPRQQRRPGSEGGGAADEARTGSNLSESARSNFSFTAAAGGASRSGSVRVADGQHGGVKRNGSSSGSSSHTYSTAKTHAGFVGLREEGPSLLLGTAARGYTPTEEREGDSPPGSPSKSRVRRSTGWLGSLRRVFSGSGSPGSGSRNESPGADSMGGASGSDYEPRLVGMGPGGRLLRRKQGREAWGEEEEEEEDWDVERAVEQRLVQVMFTVPKERLRVVNAEIEREEEAVVVDPGDEYGEEEEVVDEKVALREDYGRDDDEDPEKLALRREDEEGDRVRETTLELPSQQERPRTPITPVTIHTAEAVTLERPKTKVLQMVESIESLSRRGSPSSSPVREKEV